MIYPAVEFERILFNMSQKANKVIVMATVKARTMRGKTLLE